MVRAGGTGDEKVEVQIPFPDKNQKNAILCVS